MDLNSVCTANSIYLNSLSSNVIIPGFANLVNQIGCTTNGILHK